jgi:O-acetyl-ADP-ribose deacetylase (regulator of RNase III)
MPFQIVRDDITRFKADAIVKTADASVSGSEVKITASDEVSDYIVSFHAPQWQGGENGESAILRQCYDKSLEIAFEKNCQSIAFPLISADVFPIEQDMSVAIDAFKAFLEEHEMEIVLVVSRGFKGKVSGEAYDSISEYESSRNYPSDNACFETCDEEAPRKFGFNGKQKKQVLKKISGDDLNAYPAAFGKMQQSISAGSIEMLGASPSLDNVLKEKNDDFARHLQQLINKKNLKNSDVYTAANISKQYFSKLINGQVHPGKEKMLALAVGLRLNLDETVDFLRLAGYALSPISKTDAVVEYFIVNQDYSVIDIDIALFDRNLKPLSRE